LCIHRFRERERQILKESGETVEYVHSESLENYVMVPRSVIWRGCYPGYLGESIKGSGATSTGSVGFSPFCLNVKPVIAQSSGPFLYCGSHSVGPASFVSSVIPVVTQPISVVSVSSPELVFILKRVSSSSELVRSSTASPVGCV